jgi:prepilin-type N-terminal cleavage/methylation domain-containing protein
MDLNRRYRSKGFTIVELLIVIVVIAILAAISVVAYTGIQNRARTSEVTQSISDAKKKLELYMVDNGSYPMTGNLASAGISDGNVTYQYTSDGASYCITATSGSISYKATNTEPATSGGCPGHGQGGVAAITNLATNPGAEVTGGWASNNNSVYPAARDTTVKRSGNQSVRGHHTATNTLLMSLYAAGSVSNNGFPVEPSTPYTISFYFRSGVPHQARVLCTFRKSDGTYTSADYGAYTEGTVNQWTRTSHTCTSPSDATMMRPGIHVYALSQQPPGTYAYVDDLMVTEGSTLYPFADGSSPNWVWNGTLNGSTSTGPPL